MSLKPLGIPDDAIRDMHEFAEGLKDPDSKVGRIIAPENVKKAADAIHHAIIDKIVRDGDGVWTEKGKEADKENL